MPVEKLRVLLVEDSPGDVRLVQELLQGIRGFQAEVVPHGTLAHALEELAASSFDVVLADPGLPDSQGLDTVDRLIEALTDTPLVVLTGLADTDIAQTALQHGAQDYLPKSELNAELLARTLRYAIEREHTRRDLHQEQERLFSVLDALPMFVYLQASDHKIRFANKTFHNLFGETEKRPCYEVFHGYDGPCPTCPPMRVQQTGVAEYSEWTSPEGRTYAIYDQVFPGQSDTPLTLEVGLDITAQRAAQEALRESEERYRSFAVNFLGIAFQGAMDFTPIFFHGAVEEITGYTEADFVAGNPRWDQVIHPDDLPLVFTDDETKLQTIPGHSLEREYRIVRKDGRSRWIHEVVQNLCNDAGKPSIVQGAIYDISDRKASEAEAIAERRRVFSVLETLPAFVYLQAHDHSIPFANRRFIELFGDPAGRACHQILLGEDAPCQVCRTLPVLDTGETVVRDWATTDGRIYELHEQIFPMEEAEDLVLVIGTDVTAQRDAARQVAESEWRYRSIVGLVPVGIVTVDLKGIVTSCNKAFARMTGYERTELEHRHFSKLPPASTSDVPKYLRMFRAILVGREPEPFETTWITKNGAVREGQVRVALIRRDGKLLGAQVTVEDTTERTKMEKSLRLTQHSIDSTDVIILWVLPDGRITYVNDAASRMLGYSRDELLQKAVWDIDPDYAGKDRPRLWKELKNAGSETSEGFLRHKNGTAFPVEIRAHYLTFQGAEYEFAIAQDITERKLAEAALEQSEENYRTIFDSANDVIMLHDPDSGRLLDVNKKVEEMFGFTAEELLDLQVDDFSSGISPYVQDEALRLIHAAAAGEPQVFEWHCRKKSGELFWVEVNLRQVELLGERVILALVRDISDRKELEATLRQAQKLEALGTLASGIAHEINNPLMGMINYADLISSRIDSGELARYAEEIKGEGARIAKIVRNLLSFSRQDPEGHSPARMVDLVEASLSLVGSLLKKDNIGLEIHVPEDLPSVSCRSQQIQQVLTNLVLNARDSLNARYPSTDEDKRLQLTARLFQDDGGDWIRLTVEDHGVGMSSDVMERIFDPFYTTKPRAEGTGLGLSISYGIVRDHQGRLAVESEEGSFSRFHLDLPIARTNPRADELTD